MTDTDRAITTLAGAIATSGKKLAEAIHDLAANVGQLADAVDEATLLMSSCSAAAEDGEEWKDGGEEEEG